MNAQSFKKWIFVSSSPKSVLNASHEVNSRRFPFAFEALDGARFLVGLALLFIRFGWI